MSRFQLHWSHLLAGALLLHGTSGSAWAQPKVEPFEMPRDGRGFIPKQKHQPLNGRVIGVLVGNPTQNLVYEGRFGPGNQVCLSIDGYSYRWVYTQTDDPNAQIQNLTIPTKSGGKQVFPRLNIASARDVAKWNVVPDALVEVEVNDDKGSPATDSFVATEMRRLDGTRNYPLNVSKVLADSRAQWEKWSKEQAKVVAEKLAEARKKAIGDRKPNVPRSEQLLQYVTWMPETKRLQVRYLLRVSEGEFNGGPGGVIIDPPLLPPVDPVRPDVIRPIEEIKKRPRARPVQPVQPIQQIQPVQPKVKIEPARPVQPNPPQQLKPQIEPAPAPKNAPAQKKAPVAEEGKIVSVVIGPNGQPEFAPVQIKLVEEPDQDMPVQGVQPPVLVDPVPPGAGGGIAQPGVIIGRPGGPAVIQPVLNGKHYGVEIGVAFEYSHTGELVRILTLQPQTFVDNQPAQNILPIGPIDDLRQQQRQPGRLPAVPELPEGPAIQPAPAAPLFIDGVRVPVMQRQPAIERNPIVPVQPRPRD